MGCTRQREDVNSFIRRNYEIVAGSAEGNMDAGNILKLAYGGEPD